MAKHEVPLHESWDHDVADAASTFGVVDAVWLGPPPSKLRYDWMPAPKQMPNRGIRTSESSLARDTPPWRSSSPAPSTQLVSESSVGDTGGNATGSGGNGRQVCESSVVGTDYNEGVHRGNWQWNTHTCKWTERISGSHSTAKKKRARLNDPDVQRRARWWQSQRDSKDAGVDGDDGVGDDDHHGA